MSNENCLKGMRCPECSSEGPFKIAVTAMAEVHDDGTDEIRDVEWNDAATCKCKECGHVGKVVDFKIPDVDDSEEDDKLDAPDFDELNEAIAHPPVVPELHPVFENILSNFNKGVH